MIKSENGKTQICGRVDIVLADLTCLIQSMYENLAEKMGDEMARELIATSGRFAFMSDEELGL